MSFFSQIANAVATNIVNSLTNALPADPCKVIEVSSSSYVARAICKREQCLVLYGGGTGPTSYELVVVMLMTANKDRMYSICRSAEIDMAEHHFNIARDKLPCLSRICPDMCVLPKLQELWSLIITNPQWTATHIIAQYGILDGLKDITIPALLSIRDESTGMTPLHVAARNGKSEFLKAVIANVSNVQFDDRDVKGNTIYHYAAQASKETIEALAFCAVEGLIDAKNNEGQTPLHFACLADKPECVKALISAGANINLSSNEQGSVVHTAAASSPACAKEILTAFPNQLHAKDMKNGGTPLHWATTKEVIMALVELDCCIDARNFSGQTALHVMVQRDRFECVVALLGCGADPNLVDSDGNAPLHVAATSSNALITQALIAFGANVNLLNDKGESPRHLAAHKKSSAGILFSLHAVGAKRCSHKTPKCNDGCDPAGKDDGQSPVDDRIPRSRHLFDAMLKSVCQHAAIVNQGKLVSTAGGRILCLDGGGIRGLVLIQMLEALEQYLGAPVLKYFDWIAGTSTGGILALALTCGKSLKECKTIYLRFKDQVFVGKRPYEADALEGFLKNEFGSMTMADLKGPKVLVTAVVADTIPADLHLFRNYTSPQDMVNLPEAKKSKKPEEQLVWQAARASGAAPTYFRAFGAYLDGGLIANNPTLDVLTEIQEYNAVLNALGASGGGCVQPMVVVSLGTGSKPTQQVDTLDLFRPESLLDTARLAFGVSAFGKLLVEQVTSSDRRTVDRARSWCTNIGSAYYRLSPSFSKDVALDETKPEQLIPMLWETQSYIHVHQADFKKIAELLST